MEKLDPAHEKIAHYQLNPEVLKYFGGYQSKGVLAGTIAVAVRRPDGFLLGFIGVPLENAKFPKQFKLSFPHDN